MFLICNFCEGILCRTKSNREWAIYVFSFLC